MRTTITVDDKVFKDLMEESGAGSRNEAVLKAIAGWLEDQRYRKLLDAQGTFTFEHDWHKFRQLDVREKEAAFGKRRRR